MSTVEEMYAIKKFDIFDEMYNCRNCFRGPTAHLADDGRCLYHPRTVYVSINGQHKWSKMRTYMEHR